MFKLQGLNRFFYDKAVSRVQTQFSFACLDHYFINSFEDTVHWVDGNTMKTGTVANDKFDFRGCKSAVQIKHELFWFNDLNYFKKVSGIFT